MESGTTLLTAYMINWSTVIHEPTAQGGLHVFAAFFAEKSSEKVAYPVVLGQVLFLFLHLLQGIGHILHPTVVVLQSFLTGQISPFSIFIAPRKPSKTNTCKDVVMQKCGVWVGFSHTSPTTKAFPDLPRIRGFENFTSKQLHWHLDIANVQTHGGDFSGHGSLRKAEVHPEVEWQWVKKSCQLE